MIEPRDLRRLRWYAKALAGSIDDPEALAQVVAIQDELDDLIRARVQQLVEEGEYSWGNLAAALKVTRQTVWRKYCSNTRRPADSRDYVTSQNFD